MDTLPAGSRGLNVVCLGWLVFVVFVLPLVVVPVVLLSPPSLLLLSLLSSFLPVGVGFGELVPVSLGESSAGVLAGVGVFAGSIEGKAKVSVRP